MICPFCQQDETQVIETRASDDGEAIRRRRRCQSCGKRFTTYERIEIVMPTVVKKDGSRVDFELSKLEASISLALRKRPVSADAVAESISRIVDRVRSLGVREIASERIGEMVMDELKNLDNVGFVRFASVYRSFEDLESFAAAIAEVRPARRRRKKSAG
ncbi:MAG: transcriptional regulator NrdR [Burkholderiaceae bacterium]